MNSNEHWRTLAGLSTLLIFIFAGQASAAAMDNLRPVTVDVSSFGAQPDDGIGDVLALRLALEECGKGKSSRLILEPGRYDLVLSETDGEKKGGHDTYFRLKDIDGLTIEGNGAELVAHDIAAFFNFSHCRNITIENLTLDMDPLPFAGGKVIAVGEKYFDLEVAEPYQARAGMKCQAVLGFDPVNMRPAHRGFDAYQLDFEKTTEIVRPGVMRVFMEWVTPPLGADVTVRHQVYVYNGFSFASCINTVLRDVTIYTVAGMGVMGLDSENFTLERYRTMIRPGSGRWMTAMADATHFNKCRGTIALRDCLFENMGDDATNSHQMYMAIVAIEGPRTIRIATAVGGHWTPTAVRSGDVIEIGGGDNPLSPYCTTTIDKVEPDSEAKEITVTLTENLPEQTRAGDIIGNVSQCPKAQISNCIVRNNRARGMLIQTRDAILENNVFEQCSGAALHIASDLNYCKEGM